LHDLPGPKRVGEVVKLLEKLYKERQLVIVWVGDEGRRQILDDYLWTYARLGFLPHAVWSSGMGKIDDPIVLVGEEARPNDASILVVADGMPPSTWASTFDTVHDFVPPGDEGEERRAWWQTWQKEAVEEET
jgi:DNA polymerase IIIc chi subunit